ncbi:MAG: Polysaccharide biosynthesis protein [Microbacteriaceae bacterium]|nr:Polysaccharide biosynthesis protein [Microbacteriaceae bacterium]
MRRAGGRNLILGQIIGQGALVAVVPVLTRMVDVSAVGTFQIATAIALILQPIATLRLEFVIPSTRSGALAIRRVNLGYLVCIGLSALLALAGLFDAMVTHLFAPEVVFGGAAILLAYGWMSLDNALLIRRGAIGRLAWRNALSGVIAALLQLAAAFFWPVSIALSLSLLVGRLVAIALTRGRAEVDDDGGNGTPDQSFSFGRSLKAVASGVIANGSMQALLVTGSALFGHFAAGQLGVAQRISGTPTVFLGQSLSQLLSARAAPIIRDGTRGLTAAMWAVTSKLLVVSVLAGAALAILGPILAVPILGENWQLAGTIMACLALPLCLQVTVSSVTPVFVMLGKEGALLWQQVGRFVAVTVATIVVGTITGDIILTCLTAAALWTAGYLLNIGVFFAITREWDRTIELGEVVPAHTGNIEPPVPGFIES